jgi:hypothetical protein
MTNSVIAGSIPEQPRQRAASKRKTSLSITITTGSRFRYTTLIINTKNPLTSK